MNTQIKEKWIEALRSGRYKQGKLRLRDNDNNFCCLGVLCDIYVLQTGKAEWQPGEKDWTIVLKNGEEDTGGLTPQILAWAELPLDDALVMAGGKHLSTINDSHSEYSSFGDIADIIQKNL